MATAAAATSRCISKSRKRKINTTPIPDFFFSTGFSVSSTIVKFFFAFYLSFRPKRCDSAMWNKQIETTNEQFVCLFPYYVIIMCHCAGGQEAFSCLHCEDPTTDPMPVCMWNDFILPLLQTALLWRGHITTELTGLIIYSCSFGHSVVYQTNCCKSEDMSALQHCCCCRWAPAVNGIYKYWAFYLPHTSPQNNLMWNKIMFFIHVHSHSNRTVEHTS